MFKLKQKSTPYATVLVEVVNNSHIFRWRLESSEHLPPLLVGSSEQLPPLLLQADSLHDDGSHLEHKKQLKHDETKVHPG